MSHDLGVLGVLTVKLGVIPRTLRPGVTAVRPGVRGVGDITRDPPGESPSRLPMNERSRRFCSVRSALILSRTVSRASSKNVSRSLLFSRTILANP